jgi:hypothetical protein
MTTKNQETETTAASKALPSSSGSVRPEADTEDIWRKAVEEWCIISWCEGWDSCKTLADALNHLEKMMKQDFEERTDPKVNGGYEFRKIPSQNVEVDLIKNNDKVKISLEKMF